MKLRIIGIVAAVLFIIGSHKTAQAQNPGAPDQVCLATNNLQDAFTDPDGFVITLNHSQCVVIVSYLENLAAGHASANTGAVAECKLEQASGAFYSGEVNFGGCVSHWEAIFNELSGD